MTQTAFGTGIEPVEMPSIDSDVTPAPMPSSIDEIAGANLDAFRALIHSEMAAYVADAERRLAQAREIEQAIFSGIPRQTVHTEDLNINKHMIDGYNLTANSPAAGGIAWSNLHIVLAGVDYTIADGNMGTAAPFKKYAWFIKPASGTTATLTTGDTIPALGPNDALIFINNGGTPVSVLESSIVYAVGEGVIGNAQLDQGTKDLLTNLQNNDIQQQARIDGVITSYYQDSPPWPAGAPSTGGGDVNMGDIWYDSNDGGAFRWTGATGTPANTWQRIADTDTSQIAAKVNTKVTTYLAAASPGPTAPADGFTTGDMWMVTDQGNKLKRWSGTAWVDVLIGDGAIASGISGAKIGTGISATNVTTGTLTGSLVGTGINATNVTTGTLAGARVGTGVNAGNITTGTLPTAQVPTLTPAKLNTAFHMLY